MKKCVLFLAIFLVAAFSLSAQLTIRPQVGINSSNLTEDLNDFEFDGDLGYQIGVDFQFGNKLYLQPGLFFDFRNNTIAPIDEEESLDLTRTGFRIPVYMGYRLGDADGALSLRLFGGIGAFFVTNNDIEENNFNIDSEDFENFSLNATAGAGLDLFFLFVDVGYDFGLSEIFQDADTSPRNNLFWANAGIQLNF